MLAAVFTPCGGLLGGFFWSQRRHPAPTAYAFVQHLHLLPVVGKFLPAVQTDNVRASQRGSGPVTLCLALHRDRKAVMTVPAPEEHIHQFRYHRSPLDIIARL